MVFLLFWEKLFSCFPEIFVENNLLDIAGTYEETSDALCSHEAHVSN